MFYRCTNTPHGEAYDATGGLYEAVTEDGELDTDERGLSKKSDVPEVCASKSAPGALLGSIQARQSAGTYYIYATHETPDIDVTGATARDFAILEEVRFRPLGHVEFFLETTVAVPREAVVDIQDAYRRGSGASDTAQAVKQKLARLIETGDYPTD